MTRQEVVEILKHHSKNALLLSIHIENIKQEKQNLIDDCLPGGVDYSMPKVNGNMNVNDLKLAAVMDKIRMLDRDIEKSQERLKKINEVKERLDKLTDLGGDIIRLCYYSMPKMTFEEIAEKLELSLSAVFKLRNKAIWEIMSYENNV